MMINRRSLCLNLSQAAAMLPWLNASALFAQGRRLHADPHFFLFFQIYGAWDVCLAFDPKDREAVLPDGERQFDQPYSMNEVREFNGIPLAPAGVSLQRFTDRMSIINGIDMEIDNGHVVDAMMSGVLSPRSSASPYVQAVIGKRHAYAQSTPISHLYGTYDGQFYGGKYNDVSLTSSPADFAAFLGVENAARGRNLESLRALVEDHKSSLPSPGDRRNFGNYTYAIDQSLAVKQKLLDAGLELPEDLTTPEGTGRFVGQLFKTGILGMFSVSLGDKFFFDTHVNHYDEHPLEEALNEVSTVCSELEQIAIDDNTSVMDRTTVVIASEYSRTPRLNSISGKDHNFRSNSLVLFGHKVPSGVYGASGYRVRESGGYEPHAGLPVDFATGRPSEMGELLHPRNVWAGLSPIFGADISREFGAETNPIRFFG